MEPLHLCVLVGSPNPGNSQVYRQSLAGGPPVCF